MNKQGPPHPAPDRAIDILLAEYHDLYGLAMYRPHALERRVPIAGGTLAAFLGTVAVLPTAGQLVFLMGLPLALIWFLRTTINHARSFEDVLRRIEELESLLNTRAGEELVCFQASHPSRGHAVGGRTGRDSVTSVAVGCALLLGGCGYLMADADALPIVPLAWYFVYVGTVAAVLLRELACVTRYRYRKREHSNT